MDENLELFHEQWEEADMMVGLLEANIRFLNQQRDYWLNRRDAVLGPYLPGLVGGEAALAQIRERSKRNV